MALKTPKQVAIGLIFVLLMIWGFFFYEYQKFLQLKQSILAKKEAESQLQTLSHKKAHAIHLDCETQDVLSVVEKIKPKEMIRELHIEKIQGEFHVWAK